MPNHPESGELRLRVLLRYGEIPQWMGELLLGLDQISGVSLQVLRISPSHAPEVLPLLSRLWRARLAAFSPWNSDISASQRLVHWEGAVSNGCDVVLVLDAGLCHLPAQMVDTSLHWVVVDGAGRVLSPQFPLLAPICSGQGLQLALTQLGSTANQCRVLRRLYLGVTSQYGCAMNALSDAVLRLVRQTVCDHQLGIGTDADQAATIASTPVICDRKVDPVPRFAWWIGMKGSMRASWGRQKARVLSEYWRVGVVDSPIHTLLADVPFPPVRWLTQADASGYWADPFGLAGKPDRLVCEFFDERTGVGALEVLQFDANALLTKHTRLSVGAGQHSSFPNVFEIQGRQLGVAETLFSRECVLHEVDAAGQWHALFPLLRDVAAADPSLFAWEGRLWLAYTDTDLGTMDNLCLQYADQLEGPWTPHANNPVKLDITSARMAGGFFWHDGELYRPAQNCLNTYGGAVVIHRVTTLTPHRFTEVPVRTLGPDPQGPCPHGLHTLNAWGARTLVDGKSHRVNLIAMRRNLRHRLGGDSVRGDARRVVVYMPGLSTGGGEISLLRVAGGLAALGLQVDLVVHSLATRELDVPVGVTLHSLNCSGTASAIWRLALLLRKRRPQWVLSAFPHTNIAAVVALALSGVDGRCVISEHAPLALQIEKQGNWRYRLLPPLVRWAYRRAHAVVAVSAGVRVDLQRLLGSSVVPVVIGNPVLADNFEVEMALAPTDPWLTDDGIQVVVSVGRLSVEKDLVTLVRAFAEVHHQCPATRLLLVGEGADRHRLESLVSELGLSSVVRLPGRTATPLVWMRHAAVFVLASQYEGFGNVLVEAMACGTPVVSTDCPVGPRDILDGGRLGALVPVGDAPAMAHAIKAVLARPVQPPGAREAALRYTQANACANYLALFESLYSGGARC